jgi:aspartokinase
MTQNNITEKVSSFLDNDFIIRRCLSKNIVSLRALSRQIIKDLELKDSNLDAVMSAIRRYKKAGKEESGEKLRKLFSKLSVKTRSNVIDITLQKNKRSVENIIKLNSMIDIEKGEMMIAVQSEQSITIIIDEKNLDKFASISSKSDFISVDKKLVALNLQFTDDARSAKNIISVVSSSFSSEGINIVEIMSSAPELIIIIKKEDIVKALNVIEKLQELG